MEIKVKKNLWPKIRANLSLAKGSYAAVGFPGDTASGNQPRVDGLTNAEVAIRNEFGSAPGATLYVRSRPFLRQTFESYSKRKPFLDAASQLLGMIAEGTMSTKIALERLGTMGQTKVKQEITSPSPKFAPNSTFTVMVKQSSTPLIDTGAMRAAVTYKVRMKSGTGAK